MFLLMGSHLFPLEYLKEFRHQTILMIEDYELCTRYKYHKHKLVFFLESMRNHADELASEGFDVSYVRLDSAREKGGFESVLLEHIKRHKSREVFSFEMEGRFFRSRLSKFFEKSGVDWKTVQSPMFLNSKQNIESYFSRRKNPLMRHFYERERRERKLLMKDGQPIGGRFSFDDENRLPLPKNIEVPNPPHLKRSDHHNDVTQLIDKNFMDHPGNCEDFWLPTTRRAALAWVRNFFEKRFQLFGPYEDAISKKHPFVFHSAFSPLLNNGLLTPQEIVDTAIDEYESKKIPLNSVEGFVRQVIGWREFIRGIDHYFGERQHKSNFFNHHRKLASSWYDGTTGIEPLDDSIKKASKYGYCHHIERLMIISNLMLLCQIEPKSCYRWFMEMFVDSADWVMGPNVFGMGQFSDGGIFATKPYICGSRYLLKMGDYKKAGWADIVDGLYWLFIDSNRSFFSAQPRLGMVVSTLDRMKEERKHMLFDKARSFIREHTRN